jgi:hypothetical protein
MVPSRSASIGADGTYTIKTLIGSNAVMVNPKADGRGQSKHVAVPSRMIPFDVRPGDNTFDIELATPTTAAAAR